MPTILSHALVVSAAGQWWRQMPARFWVWTAVCAMLPDADVVGFSFGIRYDDMFGHRGFSHSIFFALVTGLAGAAAVGRRAGGSHSAGVASGKFLFRQLFLWFTAVTLSHGVLDAMTNGGRGIAFLAPFSNERYFWPWRPIQVSPIGANFFSLRGLRVLVSESVWIWLPSAIMAASARLLRRRS
jgi:inner membrane protein